MKTDAVTTSDPLRAQALAALNKAALAISRDLELDQTLQHIVDSARELVSASYAALGVFNSAGELETFVFSGLSPQEVDEIGAFPEGATEGNGSIPFTQGFAGISEPGLVYAEPTSFSIGDLCKFLPGGLLSLTRNPPLPTGREPIHSEFAPFQFVC